MSDYKYRDEYGFSLRIDRAAGSEGAIVRVVWPNGIGVGVRVPAAERQAAAQALAGDEWRVVSAKEDGGAQWPHEHESPAMAKLREIDPADVKVGDVVEVEADDGSWLVRGEVVGTDERGTDYPLQIAVDMHERGTVWPCTPGNTVRLVRRAEPEPDPEQVEALYQMLAEMHPLTIEKTLQESARELIRRGVTVRKGD